MLAATRAGQFQQHRGCLQNWKCTSLGCSCWLHLLASSCSQQNCLMLMLLRHSAWCGHLQAPWRFKSVAYEAVHKPEALMGLTLALRSGSVISAALMVKQLRMARSSTKKRAALAIAL